jgi:hypothetical protein
LAAALDLLLGAVHGLILSRPSRSQQLTLMMARVGWHQRLLQSQKQLPQSSNSCCSRMGGA